MTIHRREFLHAATAVLSISALPRVAHAQRAFVPMAGLWRTFDIVTKLTIEKPKGAVQSWVPLPSVDEADWHRSGETTWTTNAASAEIRRDPHYGAKMLHLRWAEGETSPIAEVTSRVTTQDRAIGLTAPAGAARLTDADRRLYLAATDLIPTDGIVKETAERITAGATSNIERARAIYEWIVENTFRDANVRGCGVGDIAAMLTSGNLGGKCADLNALFVGLARASGLPARDIYGIRVAPSKFGYKSLGVGSESIAKAQHCRAEIYLDGHGWLPIDPADVRKVMLEEPPGHLPIGEPRVAAARDRLFGAWEGNWIAYNFGHDIALPGANGSRIGFLMYPQAEVGGARIDCLEPDAFKYTITASEVKA
jgi:transglutaminase-like putative cysteine protease